MPQGWGACGLPVGQGLLFSLLLQKQKNERNQRSSSYNPMWWGTLSQGKNRKAQTLKYSFKNYRCCCLLKQDVVTQLTHPRPCSSARGRLHLLPPPQPPIPPLTPVLGMVGAIPGLVAVAETCPVRETHKIQVARGLPQLVGTGKRRDRVRAGGEAEGGTGHPSSFLKAPRATAGLAASTCRQEPGRALESGSVFKPSKTAALGAWNLLGALLSTAGAWAAIVA